MGKHWVVIPVDPADDMEVIHEDCPLEIQIFFGREIMVYDCAVDFEVSNSGLTEFFGHKADDESWIYDHKVYLEPGTYEIEYWQETYRGFDYTEYGAGLTLVDPPGRSPEGS